MFKKAMLTSLITLSTMNVFSADYSVDDRQQRIDNKYAQNYEFKTMNSEENIINPYIIGGTETSISDFPFYARLTLINGDMFSHICGGSILNQKYILTAAHCVDNVDISQYAIVVNKDDNNLSISDFKYIEAAHIHPEYNSSTFINDIAILELVDDISDNYSAISIGSPNEVDYYNDFDDLTVIGMGQTNTSNENPEAAEHLEKGVVSLISDTGCSEINGNLDGDKTICAAPKNGVDSCYGDSGGPLTYMGDNGYRQAGLVSYGYGSTDICADDGSITVYTEVAGFSDFIFDITGIERDVNGENDSGNPQFIESDSSGVFGFLGVFFLFGLGFFRKFK